MDLRDDVRMCIEVGVIDDIRVDVRISITIDV